MSDSRALPVDGTVTVDAPAGALTGRVRRGVVRIHTIPYATAEPFGPSRPVPPGAHDGTRPTGDVLGDGTGTPLPEGSGHMALTVTAPADGVALAEGPGDDRDRADDDGNGARAHARAAAGERPTGGRPILLWIHGGRFEEGHPSEPWCNPRKFAAGGVVTVSLGYRKKLEGFWRDPSESAAGAPYRAIDDLMIALRWVRDNAAAFGGDPGNVTLSGQSAGAGVALAVASDPRSEGFVHRLIAMSPAFSMRSGDALRRGLARIGARGTATTGRLRDTAAAGRAWRLIRAVSPTDPAVGPRLSEFRPRVPTLVTCTSREFHFVPMLRDADALPGARALARVAALLHDARGPLPPESGDRPVSAVISDATIRRYAVAVADATSAAGIPTWAGEFRPGRGHGTGPDGRKTNDAPHCVDIPRFFGRESGHPFHDEALAFIAGGDPGWPEYEAPDRIGRVWSGGGDEAVETLESDPWAGVRALFRRRVRRG